MPLETKFRQPFSKALAVDSLSRFNHSRYDFSAIASKVKMCTLVKVYAFALGMVQRCQKPPSHLPNQLCLAFHKESEVTAVPDDGSIELPAEPPGVPLDKIRDMKPGDMLDVVAVVASHNDKTTFKGGKNQTTQYIRRDVTLVDNTSTAVKLSLWGDFASLTCDWDSHPILFVKHAKVADYHGYYLATSYTTEITVNPSIPQAQELVHKQSCFVNGGSIPIFKSLSSRLPVDSVTGSTVSVTHLTSRTTIAKLTTDQSFLSCVDRSRLYVTIKGTINNFNVGDGVTTYRACPKPNCYKKVTHSDLDDCWHCPKCNTASKQVACAFNIYFCLTIYLSLSCSSHRATCCMLQ